MGLTLRNMDWLRSIRVADESGKPIPSFGQRLDQMFSDVATGVNTLEQQTNSNLAGTPPAPPGPDALTVVPHPQGVEFAIQHNSNFYQGIKYEIDATANGTTHSYDVGSSRNGFLPVGPL